ncbi:MAG: S8 family serine peptidase [Flavobacteriales bacterium]|nr:S8 family serine peptidase [Flavobacteriales bacterium]
MKLLYSFVFLFTSFVYSQNLQEREIIISKSNRDSISHLSNTIAAYSLKQQNDVQDYIKKNNLSIFDGFSLQRIVDGFPIFFATDNAGSSATLRANSLYPGGSLGLSVTGEGVTAGIWDGGKVRDTHVEFAGRIVLGDNASTNNIHSTHVFGTVLAQGVNALRRGLAYGGNGRSYDWNNDYSEMFSFANSGYLVSNHSYGNIAGSLQTYYFGNYNSQSIEIDNLMNTFPYYQVVKSAGNDRNDFNITQVGNKGGYDLLAGTSTAKNVLTVAAVDEVLSYTGAEDVIMSDFSNWGPTDDGRIKPDISAKGIAVSSTSSLSNTAYTELQGTSMAAPAITGLIVLLQKHYNNLNPSTFMKSASVRGLLCQSAREAGYDVGPDYSFGWGLADGQGAAEIITNKGTSAIFDELTLSNTSTYTTSFSINSTQDINVVISWTDPTGSANAINDEDNRTPRLRNNLDLKVIKDGTTYYPWKLDPDDPIAAATNNSDNNVDNIEKVQIFNAEPGNYTIQVSHKGTLVGSGSQDYTLIATSTSGLTLNSVDFTADNSFFVYPVPTKDFINFSNPNNFDVKEITITDLTGKTVVSNPTVSSNSIDVSNLQTGVYFVKFTTDGFSTVKKFVKN